jgi:hypothetical protein
MRDVARRAENAETLQRPGAITLCRTERGLMLLRLTRRPFRSQSDRQCARGATCPRQGSVLPPDRPRPTTHRAELLLAHGADASVRNSAGLTSDQVALRCGLEEAAELLNPSQRP